LETFKAGDLLVFEGDDADAGVVVVSGRVAMLKTSASGKDLIVELLPPGDPFCLFPTIDDQPFSVSLRAQIESTVLWVPRSRFLAALDAHPEMSRKMVVDIFSRLRKSHDLSRALAHDLVEVRVASALLALVPHFSRREDGNETEEFSIQMTRQELAEIIGSTAETVIRVCKSLERDGLIDLRKVGFVRLLDEGGLQRIAEQS
ncbi:MAG: Crp/Fnr family transcriptional regulator, partial [Bdellovibrionales bacterium]|nr:Crp/Fnr family transcriptional regulator [Bdellovibrionales bacterium]